MEEAGVTAIASLRKLKIKGLMGVDSIHELSVGVVVDIYFQLSEKWVSFFFSLLRCLENSSDFQDHHIVDGEAKKLKEKVC